MLGIPVHAAFIKLTKPLLENDNPKRICNLLAKNICALTKAKAALVVQYDEDRKMLRPAGHHNLSPSYRNLAGKDITIARTACEKRTMMLIKDIRKLYRKGDKDILKRIKGEGIVSLIAVPLIHNDTLIGGINVYFPRRIQRLKTREPLTLFAKIGASALFNARTKNMLHREKQILKSMYGIGTLFASVFTFDDVARILLKAAVEDVNGESAGLVLIDEREKLIANACEFVKDTDSIKCHVSTAQVDAGATGAILRGRKPAVFSETNISPGADPFVQKKKGRTAVGVPLLVQKKLIGILFVNFSDTSYITDDDIEYLSTLAYHSAVALDNLNLSRKVSREDKETALLYDVSQSLISTLDFDQLLNNVLQHLKETFDFLNVSVLLIDEEKQALYTHASIVYSAEDRDLRLRIGEDGITGHVAKTRRMYYSPDVSSDPHYVVGIPDTRSEVCFPLLTSDRLIGVLDVESSEVNGFSQDAIRLLSSLSAQIAIAIDNARLYEETKKLSLTDPLTSLSNRRSFELFVEAEIRRAERYRRTFVIMMIDFDNFKNYNDRYGHTAGDIVLQKLSKIMKEVIRDVDFLCRYGGDEFVVILPETDASFALDVAERMRKRIAVQKIQPKITLSIGIASFPHDARDKSRLIDLADQACYEAKQRGGNRVIFTFKPKDKK
ncbi:MAG: diguanylate cyclase [candidate division WOR-3 bacterium]|nr:MAG: diguanylate cyclase [candidate division WOR-3 bacterium]